MGVLADILKAAVERSHKLHDQQLQHVKEQGEALAENSSKPLWMIRMEQLKAAMKPLEEKTE